MPTSRPATDLRVLLLAPTQRDGQATADLLAGSHIACTVCPTLDYLCQQALLGASAVIVPEEVVLSAEADRLGERLRQQPVWSDLPVIVLSRSGAESPAVDRAMATLGNVSLIERPMRVSTLLSVVRAALRARERQYEVRDHLEARARAEVELKLSKDAAEQNLAQWHAVVESMTEGLLLADGSGRVVSMNPAALAIHDFPTLAEMLRQVDEYPKLFELYDLDGERLTPDRWPVARVIAGERFSNCELRVRRQDTGRTWIGSFSGTPARDAAGRIAVAVLTMRDVTEQKRGEAAITESEKRFRQLAETIPQLAWMADADGSITWFNRRWYDYTGSTSQQMQGWGWRRVHHPEHLPRVVERWTHSVRTGEPFEMEFPIKGADGRFRWFLTRVAPLRDSGGRIAFWFGTNTDIEDRRRIAEERAELLEAERTARLEAERAGRMKDEFLATLSHELRTPLNAILGWTQLLRVTAPTADDVAQGLDTIERNARAQTQIIEDLLDMSRIISGKVRLDVKPVDLAGVVEFAVQTVRPAVAAKGIRLDCDIALPDTPINGDPNRLQQVFWNLLSNAVKFTPTGGRVAVRLRREGAVVEVTVSDSGEGIPPEFLPHVFDRFRQADATTTRRHGGLGLGLAIVKQLVELHGGTIRAHSSGANAGATFTVRIPLTPMPQAEEPSPQPKRTNDFRSGIDEAICARLHGLKAVVVDDEPDSRAVVQRMLETCGLVVIPCGSAEEAMRRLTTDRPDVLVSDIGMPGEDGCSLVRRLRALAPEQGGDIPALALTAYARTEDRARSLRAGFQAHLVKPVDPAELIAAVAGITQALTPSRESPAPPGE